jgi:hypothetical protein
MRSMLSNSPRLAVGLYRVSTAEQGQSGLGLEAQQASVRAFAKAQGWTLVAEYSDIASGKDDHRPGFQAALVRCRQLGAVLAAARLDRITRRAHTLSQLQVERLRAEGIVGQAAMARALTERGVLTSHGGRNWTHTTVARVLARSTPRHAMVSRNPGRHVEIL